MGCITLTKAWAYRGFLKEGECVPGIQFSLMNCRIVMELLKVFLHLKQILVIMTSLEDRDFYCAKITMVGTIRGEIEEEKRRKWYQKRSKREKGMGVGVIEMHNIYTPV